MYLSELFDTNEDVISRKQAEYDGSMPRAKMDIEFGHQVFGGDKGALVKQYKRLQAVIDSINALHGEQPIDHEVRDLILDQIKTIYRGLSKLQFESLMLQYEEIEESLESFNQNNPLDSEVHVPGIGVYTIGRLIENIREKMADLYTDSQDDDPRTWRQMNHKINKGTLQAMMSALVNSFDDIENIRKQGGTRSRGIGSEFGG